MDDRRDVRFISKVKPVYNCTPKGLKIVSLHIGFHAAYSILSAFTNMIKITHKHYSLTDQYILRFKS